jgi:hypothetical protein
MTKPIEELPRPAAAGDGIRAEPNTEGGGSRLEHPKHMEDVPPQQADAPRDATDGDRASSG